MFLYNNPYCYFVDLKFFGDFYLRFKEKYRLTTNEPISDKERWVFEHYIITHIYKNEFNEWYRTYGNLMNKAHQDKLAEILQPDYPQKVNFFDNHIEND